MNQNISVENVPPTAEVRYDGFLVTDGSTVTITDSKVGFLVQMNPRIPKMIKQNWSIIGSLMERHS